MLPRTERLYADAMRNKNGLHGIVVPYGQRAARPGYQLMIEQGAFEGRMDDIRLNIQHDRNQLLGATGPTGNVELVDTPEMMSISMEYPDTQLGRDAKTLVELGALTGFCAELQVIKDEWVGGLRVCKEAILTGIGLVDRPAMPNALITEKFGKVDLDHRMVSGVIPTTVEYLADRDMRGEMEWGRPSIVSMRRRKAVLFEPGSLDVEMMPITLLLGSDFNNSAANTAGDGSLSVRKTNRGLSWRVRNLPRTDNGERILTLAKNGLITGFRVGYIGTKESKSLLEMAGIEFEITKVSNGILCDIGLSTDGSGGAGKVQTTRTSRRRRRRRRA